MKQFIPKNKQEELAQKIARGLGEEEYLPIFIGFVKRHPEEIIRRAYEEALIFPAEKIRKSRGAIFNYLVNKYDRQNKDNTKNPGH